MHALDILGDPVRRRILELLGDQRLDGRSALGAGDIGDTIRHEFGISQPAVSQHLKVLREAGFASSTVDGQRRLYAIEDAPLQAVDMWLDRYRQFWTQRLDAVDTEIRRSQRAKVAAKKKINDTGVPT